MAAGTPLHIAFFNRSFHPDTTATGQLLTELCESLVREYHWRVSVVTGWSPSDAAAAPGRAAGSWVVRRERYQGIEVVRARGTRLSKRRIWGRFADYLSYFASACYAGLRLERPDVVVALTDPPVIGLAAYLLARHHGVPLVMSFRDVFPEVGRLLEGFRSSLVDAILEATTRFLARNAERSVALGETMARRLIEGKGADPARIVIIPDWTDCAAIAPGSKRNAFSMAQGLADKFVVMHSGNLGLAQALESVVAAATHLAAHPDIAIVFVGDGVRRPALEAQARAAGLVNVRFLPYQPKEHLAESFATADVFLVSLRQGLAGYVVPSKLYGILAAGRPYVAAVEGTSEVATITRRHGCGLIAEPGDPRDLADKVLTLYRDRTLAERLGRNARRAALEFDRPIHVRAYDELLREVAGARSRGGPRLGVRPTPRLKRAFDVVLAGAGLVLSAPLWLCIGALVKLEDGGPVFFRDRRAGRGGALFDLWKFRSMVADADADFGPRQASAHDPRVTRVGRLLRATAMDELPQLWSILRGEMSFVGPRALRPAEICVRGDGRVLPLGALAGHGERQGVAPGLTGLAQVYADRDAPLRQKLRYDRLYVRRQGLWLDLRLVTLSFWISARGRWERRGRKA